MKFLNTKHIKVQQKPVRQNKLEKPQSPKLELTPIPHDPTPPGYRCSLVYFPWF